MDSKKFPVNFRATIFAQQTLSDESLLIRDPRSRLHQHSAQKGQLEINKLEFSQPLRCFAIVAALFLLDEPIHVEGIYAMDL